MAKPKYAPVTEADDLGATDIPPPVRELESHNALLREPEALRAFFDESGYLLFRDVLDIEAVSQTRRKMVAVLAERGMVKRGPDESVWTGAHWDDLNEHSAEFCGLGEALASTPHNKALFDTLVGESTSLLPIVQTVSIRRAIRSACRIKMASSPRSPVSSACGCRSLTSIDPWVA